MKRNASTVVSARRREDARQIAENVTGFFCIRADWSKAEIATPANNIRHQPDRSGTRQQLLQGGIQAGRCGAVSAAEGALSHPPFGERGGAYPVDRRGCGDRAISSAGDRVAVWEWLRGCYFWQAPRRCGLVRASS
jgi:hypothetical protein